MFGPGPVKPDKETCKCDAGKKKEKKKRKERAVCYKGTYQQRRNGTIFRPTEEVPCDSALPKKARGPRKARKRTPKWTDILDDVFGLPKP